MSEDQEIKPKIGRREFFKRAGIAAGGIVGAVATGAAMVGLAVSSRKPEALESEGIENDPVLSKLAEYNRDILAFEPSSDPERLQELYQLATQRRTEMSGLLTNHPDIARMYIRHDTRARDKLKSVFEQNMDVLENDIFKSKGQADRVEWLTEEEVGFITGKVNQVMPSGQKSSQPTSYHYIFYPVGKEEMFGLHTNQNLFPANNPDGPKLGVTVTRGIKIINDVFADDNAVKAI